MSKWALIVILCWLAPAAAFAQVGGAGGGKSGDIGVNQKNLLSCEDQLNSVCRIESQWEYEPVAASQTDQIFGTTGAAGDLVNSVKCVTSAASVGAVTIKDGTGSAITLFNAQLAANDALNKDNMNWVSTDGGWKLTTGTNTTCTISGRAN